MLRIRAVMKKYGHLGAILTSPHEHKSQYALVHPTVMPHYYMELRILFSKFPDNNFQYFLRSKIRENNRHNQYWPGLYWSIKNRVSHTLNNWVEVVCDEAYYPWESPKKIWLKLVNPTFVSEQKKVSIH